MHPSLRVYIQYTGLCDGINWLHNNHTQYKIVYNKQSKYDRQCYEQTCLTEMPPAFRVFSLGINPMLYHIPTARSPRHLPAP